MQEPKQLVDLTWHEYTDERKKMNNLQIPVRSGVSNAGPSHLLFP